MTKSKLNRFMQICLDIAEYYDTIGEESDYVLEDKMLKELGLGYRALSGYLRAGVKEVIDLQDDYHTIYLLHKAEKADRKPVSEEKEESKGE